MKARLIELSQNSAAYINIKLIEENHFTTPFHFHDYCELNYVKKSSGKRIVGDHIDNFGSGDLVLMSPNLPHMWCNQPLSDMPQEQNSAQAIIIYFSFDLLDLLTDNAMLLTKKNTLLEKAKRGLLFHGSTKEKIISHLESMILLEGLPQIIEFLKILDVFLESKDYTALTSTGYTHHYNERDEERMNNVYNFLLQKFTEQIRLEEVAQVACMTPPAFCNYFKKNTQKSFSRFLNELRIGHACQLLQNDNYSITEICFKSGFNNIANFNRFFKVITGRSPSVYRKEYQIFL